MIKNKIFLNILFLILVITLFGIKNVSADSSIPEQNFGVFELDREIYNGLPSKGGQPLWTRLANYLFEGEVIYKQVIALHLDGVENIEDIYMTLSRDLNLPPNGKINSCILAEQPEEGLEIENVRIGEQYFYVFNPEIMALYDCYFIVEDRDLMYEEYWYGIEILDSNGLYNDLDENEYWFLNPIPILNVYNEEELNFGNQLAGQTIYSDFITVKNNLSENYGSGLSLNVKISGVDFIKGSINNCNILNHISYYAENENYQNSYNTFSDIRADEEGYIPLSQEDSDVIMGDWGDIPEDIILNGYVESLLLYDESSEMLIKFRIDIPEGCYGNFNGNIKSSHQSFFFFL